MHYTDVDFHGTLWLALSCCFDQWMLHFEDLRQSRPNSIQMMKCIERKKHQHSMKHIHS
jgi:hypothetical protein